MDKFSAENEELGFQRNTGGSPLGLEGADIEFDEDNIDIDEIQKKLQAHMAGEELVSLEPPQETIKIEPILQSENSQNAEIALPIGQSSSDAPPVVETGSKKYVIYIDPDNIDVMDKLSINDRKAVINSILREHDERVAKQIAENRKKRFMRHVIIATMTFIIGFPLLFIMVNKAMEISMTNYNQAQKNFSTLYKDGGKIKQSLPASSTNYKY